MSTKLITKLLMTLLPALGFVMGSCSSKDEPRDGTVTVCLRASTGSRTVLESEVGSQNISEVYLCVYQVPQEGAKADAECVYYKQIDWTLGDVSNVYTIDYKFTRGMSYVIGAVGYDEESKGTYNFPNCLKAKTAVDAGISYSAVVEAASAAGMRESEFFSGDITINYTGQENIQRDIKMTRRVSGMMVYLCNLPVDENAKAVELRHVRKLNKKSYILNHGLSIDDDVVVSSTDADRLDTDVLLRMEAADFKSKDELPADKQFDIDVKNYGKKGVFMLPMEKPATGDWTLKLVVIYQDDTERTSYVDLGEKDDYGNVITSKIYPIQMNSIYTIGSEQRPIDLRFKEGENYIDVMGSWQGDVNMSF